MHLQVYKRNNALKSVQYDYNSENSLAIQTPLQSNGNRVSTDFPALASMIYHPGSLAQLR